MMNQAPDPASAQDDTPPPPAAVLTLPSIEELLAHAPPRRFYEYKHLPPKTECERALDMEPGDPADTLRAVYIAARIHREGDPVERLAFDFFAAGPGWPVELRRAILNAYPVTLYFEHRLPPVPSPQPPMPTPRNQSKGFRSSLRANTAAKTTYAEKLRDVRWKRKRDDLLRANYTCCECGEPLTAGTMDLQVHHVVHISCLDPWDYPDELLLVVCDWHHQERQAVEQAIFADVGKHLATLDIHQMRRQPIYAFFEGDSTLGYLPLGMREVAQVRAQSGREYRR